MSVPPLNRILYVEDDPDIQEIAAMTLTALGGFTIEACSSGQEAIDAAAKFAPDLILLDVMMPGMDGPTTLGELRRIPQTAATPVVFMTAKVQPQEVARYRELGALDVIFKPFDPMALCETIRETWTRHHGGHG